MIGYFSKNTFLISCQRDIYDATFTGAHGYFLYYSILNGKVVLAKSEKIPSYDKSSLWAQEDKNRVAMMELFGLDFPAPEKPSDEEFDKEHDMLPDNDGEVMGEEEFNDAVGDE